MSLFQIGIILIVIGYSASWFLWVVGLTTYLTEKNFKWMVAALIISGLIGIAGIGIEIYDSYNKTQNIELINNE